MNQAAKRAAELANAETRKRYATYTPAMFMPGFASPSQGALVKLIQQVSDVAKRVLAGEYTMLSADATDLRALILPDDADPLAEAIKGASITGRPVTWEEKASALRAELAARGLCIAPVKGGSTDHG